MPRCGPSRCIPRGRDPAGIRLRGEESSSVSNDLRVFVTGSGVVSPLGNCTDVFWKNLIAGTSGAGPITRFDASAYGTRFACEVKDFSYEGIIDRKDAKRMDRFVQFAVVATH